MGDLRGARAALRRADDRGDAGGASNLGVLLERQGDLDGAIAAYRRADERGHAVGAFNLAQLLAARGDLAGAQAAYRRAAERGDPEMQKRALTKAGALAGDVDPAPCAAAEALTSDKAHTSEESDVSARPMPEAFSSEGASAPGRGTTDSAASVAPNQSEADGQRCAQPKDTELVAPTESVAPLRVDQTSESHWLGALCALALVGLIVLVIGHVRRRSRGRA
jgi:tetratricopeptide (TPR) repeat protein